MEVCECAVGDETRRNVAVSVPTDATDADKIPYKVHIAVT